MLTQSQVLASYIWRVDDMVAYSYDEEPNLKFFYIDAAVWEDMGRPETLTLTITPGDTLNV